MMHSCWIANIIDVTTRTLWLAFTFAQPFSCLLLRSCIGWFSERRFVHSIALPAAHLLTCLFVTVWILLKRESEFKNTRLSVKSNILLFTNLWRTYFLFRSRQHCWARKRISTPPITSRSPNLAEQLSKKWFDQLFDLRLSMKYVTEKLYTTLLICSNTLSVWEDNLRVFTSMWCRMQATCNPWFPHRRKKNRKIDSSCSQFQNKIMLRNNNMSSKKNSIFQNNASFSSVF